MESRWIISFEDTVYLIISAGLFCLIITWMLSVLLVSKRSYDYELLHTPSISLIPESLLQKGIESHSPPSVSQQFTHALNIHPLKVVRLHSKTNTPPLSSQSSCIKGDCNQASQPDWCIVRLSVHIVLPFNVTYPFDEHLSTYLILAGKVNNYQKLCQRVQNQEIIRAISQLTQPGK